MKRIVLKARELALLVLVAATVSARAQTPDVITELLNAPAPEPGWGAGTETLESTRVLVGSTSGVILANEVPAVAPPDEAAADELVGFWTARARREDRSLEPSPVTRERLLVSCEENPAILVVLLDFLPDTGAAHDRVKALLDQAERDGQRTARWREAVRSWLMFRSEYFRDELVAAAQSVHDQDGRVHGATELKALATLDWASAAPLLRAFERSDQPRTAALATTIAYAHSIEARTGDVETYRSRLRAILEDTNAPGRARDMAFDALMETAWEGRDEWYLSLFSDGTLLRVRDGSTLFSPLTGPVARDPERWIPIVTEMVGHGNRAVHDNAVRSLVQFHLDRAREDALRPLLPWLMDGEWSSAPDRLRLIQTTDRIDMSESVPGLIQIVENEDDAYERSYAAESLAKYADPLAVQALRAALQKETGEQHRKRIIQGLVASGGVGEMEAADAIEALARETSTPEGRERLAGAFYSFGSDPLPLPVSLGLHLSRFGPPSEGVAASVLARARELESVRPEIAASMLETVHRAWALEIVDRDIVQRIRSFTAPASSIRAALDRRDSVRNNVSDELRALVELGGARGSIAGVLLGDREAELSFLSGADAEARRALLACARLVREPLPIEVVGRLLESGDEELERAAMLYLESEDSIEARRLVLASRPDEALIIGARQGQDPGHNTYSYFDDVEEELRELVLTESAPDEIVALLSASYWGGDNHILIRRWADRVELAYHEDEARYYERSMEASEWETLAAFLIDNNVDDLPPLVTMTFDGRQYEYVRIGRAGGRRVFMNNPETDSIYGRLVARFHRLVREPELSVRYYFARAVDGLELLTDPRRPAGTVWSANDQVRVLVLDENGMPLEWRVWTDELGDVVAEPDGIRLIAATSDIPEGMNADVYLSSNTWQIASDEYRVRAGLWGDSTGLWKCREGQEPLLIREGIYASPVVTPDGKWVVVAKTQTHWADPNVVVRIRLEDGREYPVGVEAASTLVPKVYVDAHHKVLLARAEHEDAEPEYLLLDPESGEAEVVEGQFEPLVQQTFRALQPAGSPHVFWATRVEHSPPRTVLGHYDARSFVFRDVMEIPAIRFSSMDVLVEEGAERVWLVYGGDLLRFPLAR